MSEKLPMPTRGPVSIAWDSVDECYTIGPSDEQDNNYDIAVFGKEVDADLIAVAFNAATAAADMGFDPIGAVEALPKLLAIVNEAPELVHFFHGSSGWTEYQKSPEMVRIYAALAAARQRGGAS